MKSAQLHLRKFPHARKSTLAILEKRDETTARLKAEIAAVRWRKRLSWLSWIWRRA